MADKKVIATTVIHRTLEPGTAAKDGSPAKRPKIQVIQPGTVFMASTDDRKGYDKSEYDELKSLGAIRDPGKDEKVEVSVENVVTTSAGTKKTTTKQTSQTGSGENGGSGSGDKTVADMTGDELDAYLEASEHTAPEGWSSMKVAEKKAWLTNADAGGNLV